MFLRVEFQALSKREQKSTQPPHRAKMENTLGQRGRVQRVTRVPAHGVKEAKAKPAKELVTQSSCGSSGNQTREEMDSEPLTAIGF